MLVCIELSKIRTGVISEAPVGPNARARAPRLAARLVSRSAVAPGDAYRSIKKIRT